jgi:hypothetical protein
MMPQQLEIRLAAGSSWAIQLAAPGVEVIGNGESSQPSRRDWGIKPGGHKAIPTESFGSRTAATRVVVEAAQSDAKESNTVRRSRPNSYGSATSIDLLPTSLDSLTSSLRHTMHHLHV